MSLAACLALAACGSDPASEVGLETSAESGPPPDSRLGEAIGDGPGPVIAGERLNGEALRGFYARHGYSPVWATRPLQAASLLAAVHRAPDQGLDPALFHAAALRRSEDLSPLDRELVLSAAFLSYTDALARGAVPVERRGEDEVLTPGPVDAAAALDSALDSADPGAAIERLAPATPTYLALRAALRRVRMGGPADSLRAIVVNLERQRWLPRHLPADRVWVNVAAERLTMYRANRPAFSTRVVVGEDVQKNQSPEFHATIDASFYNPPWVIPADIAAAEILPKLKRDPDYLTRNRMVLLTHGEVEQLPGPQAGLGLIMFDMPNRFDVYLHDTPDRDTIFNRDNRRISHGCIRVQDPRELASLLLRQPIEAIDRGIATGDTIRKALPEPMPVFVVYQTAYTNADGVLEFRPDFYDRDPAIWRQLQARPGASERGLLTG